MPAVPPPVLHTFRSRSAAVAVAMAIMVSAAAAAGWSAWHGRDMVDMALTWLLRPWSGFPHHAVPSWLAWHGRLMVAAWAVLIPLGILVARYGKVLPAQDWPSERDNRTWWHGHRILQSVGLGVASVGCFLAWRFATGAGTVAYWHGVSGLTMMAAGWAQVAMGVLRGSKGGPTDPRGMRGDHFDMTRRRRMFERVHKTLGHAVAASAVPVLLAGLYLADAPRWMWLCIGAWWLVMGVAAVRLQRAGRCIDTYQAIWGADPDLPGNRVVPIGPGIARLASKRSDRS